MSRVNPFANLDLSQIQEPSTPKSGYGMTGAAKTVVRSIEEMAENTKKLMDGETIVELDPSLLDVSFIADRLSDQDEEYIELKSAIQEQGQSTPILVRPNPNDNSRYMVVFGHRRAKVAKDIGIKVKAIIKILDDADSAVIQGQENSARSNLSFIERAFFAKNMLAAGLSKDTVKAAIALDDAMLSKMLSVIESVPQTLLNALGACKGIGRDKWLSLRQLILNPAFKKVAEEYARNPEFLALEFEQRFAHLLAYLTKYKAKSVAKIPKTKGAAKSWTSKDESATITAKSKSKSYELTLSGKEKSGFGEWITEHADRLYDEYIQSKSN